MKQTLSRHARGALAIVCMAALPITALAEASRPTANDPQTGAPIAHHTTHKMKKPSNTSGTNSTGGASNSPNAVGVGNGPPGNNSGADTAPVKGAGGGN